MLSTKLKTAVLAAVTPAGPPTLQALAANGNRINAGGELVEFAEW